MSEKCQHDWWTWVPIPVHVIKNEDDVFSFRFRFDVGKEATGMDEAVVAQFNPDQTGCGKCQKELKDVFGEFCRK